MPDLLIELYSEEMPATLQESGANLLRNSLLNFLDEEKLKYGASKIYWSPLRLAFILKDINTQTDDIKVEKRGPRKEANDSSISGFAKSIGVKVADLNIEDTPKGSFYFYKYTKKGLSSSIIIEKSLKKVINNFAWNKSMRWGASELRWVRPLHSILCIYDNKPIAFSIKNIKCSNYTFGHKYIKPEKIIVNTTSEYLEKLKTVKVIIDAKERMDIIKKEGRVLSNDKNLIFDPSDNLLKEVVNLVEYPYLFIAEFDDNFLSLPDEILKLTMMKQQKYFPLVNKKKKISNKFIGVSNIPINNDQIIVGNEKVLKARLADARFFYNNDIKNGLIKFSKELKKIIFHRLLGSMDSKVSRIKVFIEENYKIFKVDKNLSLISADLSKADLCSEVVYEMPELQGIIGSKYSEIEGYDPRVSLAIKEHYSPQGPNDICPTKPESSILAFADKLDTLVGFMACDLKPTGSKDPYAIRRCGLGLIRIILENKIRISFKDIILSAYGKYKVQKISLIHSESETVKITMNFLMDRFRGYIREKNLPFSCILSVCNVTKVDDFFDISERVYALHNFIRTDKGKIFIRSLKRVRRILDIEEKKYKANYEGNIDERLLVEKEERDLYDHYNKINMKTVDLLVNEKYEEAMLSFLKIENKLEKFFDNVQVNVEDENIRINRLNILSSIRKTFIDYADFSLIEIENEVT